MFFPGLLPYQKTADQPPGPVQATNATPMVAPVARHADAGVAGGLTGGIRQPSTVAAARPAPPSLPTSPGLPGLKAPKKIGSVVDTRGPQPGMAATVGSALGADPRASMGGVAGAMHALTPLHTGVALLGLGGTVAGLGTEVYDYVQARRERQAREALPLPKLGMMLPIVGLNVQAGDFTPNGLKRTGGNLLSGLGDHTAQLLENEQVEKPNLTPFMLRDQNPRIP
ncbi:MAG: hypothetical protein SGJ01_13640 [Gemmatimonadota bacterium]|nr:hypothetical protein [Gemmatimonadota bacterium]